MGVSEPFGISLTFGYDANGNRVLVQDSFGGTTQSTYDAANQLVSELFTQQGMPTMRIDQTYNADGEVATQTRYSDAAGQNVVATSDYRGGKQVEGSRCLEPFFLECRLAARVLAEDPKPLTVRMCTGKRPVSG